jgi:hypothetical protein
MARPRARRRIARARAEYIYKHTDLYTIQISPPRERDVLRIYGHMYHRVHDSHPSGFTRAILHTFLN